jgi:hypothetical protein
MIHDQKGRGSVAQSLRILLAVAMVAGVLGVFASTGALADGTFNWEGQGFPNASCTTNPLTMLWIFNDNGSAVPTTLTINGEVQSGSWVHKGGGAYQFTATVDGVNFPPDTASVTYTGTLGSNTVLTLSGCNEGILPASLTVLKSIPNVLQGSETVTFTFQAILNGVVKGSCQVTFTAGETNDQCTITGLEPNTTYTIHEVPQAPWVVQPDQDVTTGGPGTNTADVTFTNNFGPATATACKVTDVDHTGHDSTGDTFSFDLVADGDTANPVETVTVTIGTSENDCESFAAALEEGVTYTIVEETPATGWTQESLVCDVNGQTATDFTPDYPADADAIFTCTATNSITAAHATVRKVTIPAGSEAGFTFHLFADGVEVASATSTDANALAFTPDVDLQDGVHYTVTEDPKAEWNSNGGVGCDFTVSYPADSGATFDCVFTNTHVSAGLTIGYWKTHLAFDSRHPDAPYTAKYLPQLLGTYVVDTTAKATAVFNANDCSSKTSAGINCLAAQLLAAELNVANNASNCADGIIADANTFLSGGTVDGVTGVVYTGPKTYTVTAAQRAEAISLKTALDMYNNGTCPV